MADKKIAEVYKNDPDKDVYVSSDKKEIEYFAGTSGQNKLESLQNWYRKTLGKKLDVDPESITLPEFDYKNMRNVPLEVGQAYPDVLKHYATDGITARDLFSGNIIKGTKGIVMETIDGVNVPTVRYEYAFPGSKEHEEFKAGTQPFEEVKALLPAGYTEDGEPLYSGSIIDRRRNILRVNKQTLPQIIDMVSGWESGNIFRNKRGIKDLPLLSSIESPLDFAVDENGELLTGKPYLLEQSALGRVINFSPDSAHFRFKPNALGTPTEFPIKVGKMLFGQVANTSASWTLDMGPGLTEIGLRLTGGAIQLGSDTIYGIRSLPLHSGIALNSDQYKFDKNGVPIATFSPRDNIINQHQFIYDLYNSVGLETPEKIYPKNPMANFLHTQADKLAPLYARNYLAAALVSPSSIDDALLGREPVMEQSITDILTLRDAPWGTRLAQNIPAAWTGWRFVDRALGKIIGTGLPKGRSLLKEITKDAEELFKADEAWQNANKVFGRAPKWKELSSNSQELFILRATANFLNKEENFKQFYKSKFFTKGRIAAAKNEKVYNMIGTNMSNSMVIGGIAAEEIFGKDNPWAFLSGSVIMGITNPTLIGSRFWGKNIKGFTFREPNIGGLYQVPLDLTGSFLSGIRATVNTLDTMFSKKNAGTFTLPIEQEIKNIAAIIPALTYKDSKGKTKTITQGQRENFALYLINLRNAAIEAGDEGQIIKSIERGKQFINDLDSMPEEFVNNFNLSLNGIKNLVSTRIIDNMVDNMVDLGPTVRMHDIEQSVIRLRESRETALQLSEMLEPMLKAMPENEATARLAPYLSKMRGYVADQMKYTDMRIEDLQNLSGILYELSTTQDFAGAMLNATNQMQIAKIMVELKKLEIDDPQIINETINNARKRINENTLSIVNHMQRRSEEFTDLEGAKTFVDLVHHQDNLISSRADVMYRELKKELAGRPINLQNINNVLKAKFYTVDVNENSLRGSHGAEIKELVGESVRVQLEHAIRDRAIRDASDRFGPTGFTEDQLNNIIKENRQQIAADAGLPKGFRNNYDYAEFYNVLTTDSKLADGLIETLIEAAPMATQGFIIPAQTAFKIHRLLVGGRRGYGEKGSPQYKAYEEGINILETEMAVNDPQILTMIKEVSDLFANEFNHNINGLFRQKYSKVVGVDSNKGQFMSSSVNHSNKLYKKAPSLWLDEIVDDILNGNWEQASLALKDGFGQLGTIRRPYQPAGLGDNLPETAAGSIRRPPVESSERIIVDPHTRMVLASLIDWKIFQKLNTEKGFKKFVKENTQFDIDKAPKDLVMEKWQKMSDSIRAFNDSMDLKAGTEYHLLDTINYKGGVMGTVTDDMASVKFLSSGSHIMGDSLSLIETTLRDIIKASPKLKHVHKRFVRNVNNSIQKAQGRIGVELKQTNRDIQNYERFMRDVVGSEFEHFDLDRAFDVFTKENGRLALSYLDELQKKGVSKADYDSGVNFVKFVMYEGYRRRTTADLIDDRGSRLTTKEGPDGRIYEDYITVPLVDQIQEMEDLLGPILWDKNFGIFKDKNHYDRFKSITTNQHNLTAKALGLSIADLTDDAARKVKAVDAPTGSTTNMHISNIAAFVKHKVSLTYLFFTAAAREWRMRELGFYQVLIAEPEVTDILYNLMKSGGNTSPATVRKVEGQLSSKFPQLVGKIWSQNYVADFVRNDRDQLLTGPIDELLSIDEPVNIEGAKKSIEIQLDEIFDLNKDRLQTTIQ